MPKSPRLILRARMPRHRNCVPCGYFGSRRKTRSTDLPSAALRISEPASSRRCTGAAAMPPIAGWRRIRTEWRRHAAYNTTSVMVSVRSGFSRLSPRRRRASALSVSLFPRVDRLGLRARLVLNAVAMQVVAVSVEPGLGALDVTADPADHPPEPRRMIHFDEMGHLMAGEIIQHIGRRQDQPPRERQ